MDAGAAFAVAFGVVALAEIGDKSQLVLLAQATRSPPRGVALEAVAAFAILSAVAVVAGAAVARFLPAWAVALASGLVFLAFGALALRSAMQDKPEDGTPPVPPRRGRTFGLVLLSEMGDKTQVATAALAASSGQAIATGLGAWLAESALAVAAVAVGASLTRRIPPRTRSLAAGIVFLVLGTLTLAVAAWASLR